MLKQWTVFTIFLVSAQLFAQSSGNISGRVIDAKSLLPLPGATVVVDGTNIGVITDDNGFFILQDIPTATYNITANFLGFENQTKFNVIIKSVGSNDLLFKLEEISELLKEVVVAKSPFRTSKETPQIGRAHV